MRNHIPYAKLSEHSFGMPKVEYIGHLISRTRVETDPKKIDTTLQWEQPKTQKQATSLLGLLGYHMRFIQSYAMISKPLLIC